MTGVQTCALPIYPAVYHPPVQTIGVLEASLELTDILPWCDEQPNLYDLYLNIEDRNGRDLVSVHHSVGFRMIDWKSGRLTVNGRAVQMRAVSWGESNEPAWSGSNLGPVTRLLTLFKKNRLNTIYFRDNPPDPILLDLCSILGFYVIEDAPFDVADPDWLAQWPGQDPDLLLNLALDKLERTIRRDYNQPCVLSWSAGILAQSQIRGRTAWLGRLVEQIHQLDPTRPIHGWDIPGIATELDQWLTAGSLTRPADLSWMLGIPPSQAVQKSANQQTAIQPTADRLTAPWSQPSSRSDNGRCYYALSQPVSLLSGIAALFPPIVIQATDAAAGRFLVHNQLAWTDLSIGRAHV